MKKILIGIVGKPDNTDDPWNYICVNNEIRECLNKNNALTIGILPQDFKFRKQGDNKYKLNKKEKDDLRQIVSKVDGVVLQGGIVNNSYEQEIIKICLAYDLPILCICYGFNNMIKVLGGTLVYDELGIHEKCNNGMYDVNNTHEVILNKKSRLFNIIGKKKIIVNSIHRKIATTNSVKNCDIVGICQLDNSVEAIEVPNKKFAIGIKWHPELMQDEKCMNNIFESFIESCK